MQTYQITNGIFHRTRAKTFKVCMETQNNQTILRKKDRTGGIMYPDFRKGYKTVVIKTEWYWHKNRYQINGTGQKMEKETYILNDQSIYDKEGKKTHCRKYNLFNKWL